MEARLKSNWRRIQFNPTSRFVFFDYLITLSALASTFGGIVRPICLAAFNDEQLELRRCSQTVFLTLIINSRHHVDHLVAEAFLGCYLDRLVLSQFQCL
jgi:hypothetical protein